VTMEKKQQRSDAIFAGVRKTRKDSQPGQSTSAPRAGGTTVRHAGRHSVRLCVLTATTPQAKKDRDCSILRVEIRGTKDNLNDKGKF